MRSTWDVSERVRNKIADKNDVVPRSENEAKHIRQVTPGDGMRKLQPETIEKLNELFEPQLAYFGYEPGGRCALSEGRYCRHQSGSVS